MSRDRFGGVGGRLVGTLALGTSLNPLNSSMIAVALAQLQTDFRVGVGTSSWLVSAFYIGAAVGQPLMGRLVDQVGARRMFMVGLAVVLVASAATPFVPGFWWLVGLRVVQAFGTSTAYPAALVLIRSATPEDRAPTAGLGAITVASSTSAALGPVLGGFLVSGAGWQAVFLVNVPICLAGLVLAWRVLPRQRSGEAPAARRVLAELDLPGVVLFSATMVTLLLGVLSFTRTPHAWLLVVAAAAAVALVLRERSVAAPFLDVRALVANRALTSVLVQQGVVNFVFYCTFFALPLWLERVRGYSSDQAGLFILPVAGLGVLTVPVAARLVRTHGSRAALVLGSAVLLLATGAIQLLGDATPAVLIVVFGLLLGVPNGFNNLGLQTALYEAAPGGRTGAAGGLFQTSRYLGAIAATATIGVLLDRDLSSDGLHALGLVMTGGAVLVLALALLARRTVRA
ncbi:MFS transporter [Microlunatus antarcticus]